MYDYSYVSRTHAQLSTGACCHVTSTCGCMTLNFILHAAVLRTSCVTRSATSLRVHIQCRVRVSNESRLRQDKLTQRSQILYLPHTPGTKVIKCYRGGFVSVVLSVCLSETFYLCLTRTQMHLKTSCGSYD